MFFDTKLNNHNLPYNPFKGCVVPRPIAWISSIDGKGNVNIGPYSYFNAVADIPPVIMYASAYKDQVQQKDSMRNIEETGEFVVNIATYNQRELVNLSSTALEYGESEAQKFNIALTTSTMVKPPRIKDSPINLECKYLKTIDIEVDKKQASSQIILGHVVGIHIADFLLENGKVSIAKLKPIARLGYNEYAVIEQIFTMTKP